MQLNAALSFFMR